MSAPRATKNTNRDDFTGRVDYITSAGNPSHFYKIDGAKVPGVTTIIGGGVPKPGLLPWAAEMAATAAVDQPDWYLMGRDDAIAWLKGEPNRVRDAAGLRGTILHDHAETYGHTGVVPDDLDPEQVPLVAQLVRFFDEWQVEPLIIEGVVLSKVHRYCGTFDLVARVPGLCDGRVLIDWKTARKGIYAEIALQMAAYRYAEAYIGPGDQLCPMPAIDRCLGVHLTDTGYEVREITAGPDEMNDFLHAKAVYEFGLRGRRKDSPVSDPIPTPAPVLTLVGATSDPFEGLPR